MLRRFLPFALGALPLALSVGMHAQVSVPSNPPLPNFNLYGGFSYVFTEYGGTLNKVGTYGMNGWDASLKVPLFTSWLGIKGDVSGRYNNESEPDFNPKAYTFLLGPEVSIPLGRSTVFVHGLVGSSRVSDNVLPSLRTSDTLAVAVGGGLDAGISRHWAWRIAGDYFNTHYDQTNNNVREILNSNGRISTGPVFRF
jgi:hypothetical protein